MGIPFPIGMKLAQTRISGLVSWLWGVNGAASVCGSVLAIFISYLVGINAVFWAWSNFFISWL